MLRHIPSSIFWLFPSILGNAFTLCHDWFKNEDQTSHSPTCFWRDPEVHIIWSKVKVAQSCPSLCDHMHCSLPGYSVHGILQARILEWVAISSFKGSSWPWDQTWVSCIAGRFFTIWTTRDAPMACYSALKRNKIGSFVVMWMDLESVIQSELSQKEKNKYCILMHI